MKKIYLGLSIVLLLCVIYLAMVNFNNYALINVLSGMDIHRDGLVANGQYLAKAVRISTYTVLILLSGIFVGAGTVYMFSSAQKEKVKAYQRDLENTSISGLDNASRVEVLEAKIKTLEKAFNTVIDERTKLEVQIKTLNAEIDNMNKG